MPVGPALTVALSLPVADEMLARAEAELTGMRGAAVPSSSRWLFWAAKGRRICGGKVSTDGENAPNEIVSSSNLAGFQLQIWRSDLCFCGN